MLPALVVVFLACVLGLSLLFPRAALIVWIVALETSPDDWLAQLIGRHETIVAVIKGYGLVLLAVLALRHGLRRDRYNPAFAFGAMYLTGLIHGLYPGLTLLASTRSLIGSAAPFLFAFIRLPPHIIRAIIRAALWGPLVSVAFGGLLAALGLHAMYMVEQGVLRLGAAGEPPFLAGFALVGLYAGLMEFLASPRLGAAGLVLANFIIILLTGARAPLALAVGIILVLLVLQYRLFLLAFAGLLASAAVLFSGALSFIRIIGLARLGEAANLSHRNLVWPYFEHAFLASPFFGWGVGAGKVVIPYNATLATLLGTNAAHDEYLRIGTEGGAFGLILLILLLGLWGYRGSAHLPVAQRLFMRLIFIGFAIQSATDNTLIATTSSVLFLWCSGIFASSEKPPKAAA